MLHCRLSLSGGLLRLSDDRGHTLGHTYPRSFPSLVNPSSTAPNSELSTSSSCVVFLHQFLILRDELLSCLLELRALGCTQSTAPCAPPPRPDPTSPPGTFMLLVFGICEEGCIAQLRAIVPDTKELLEPNLV